MTKCMIDQNENFCLKRPTTDYILNETNTTEELDKETLLQTISKTVGTLSSSTYQLDETESIGLANVLNVIVHNYKSQLIETPIEEETIPEDTQLLDAAQLLDSASTMDHAQLVDNSLKIMDALELIAHHIAFSHKSHKTAHRRRFQHIYKASDLAKSEIAAIRKSAWTQLIWGSISIGISMIGAASALHKTCKLDANSATLKIDSEKIDKIKGLWDTFAKIADLGKEVHGRFDEANKNKMGTRKQIADRHYEDAGSEVQHKKQAKDSFWEMMKKVLDAETQNKMNAMGK